MGLNMALIWIALASYAFFQTCLAQNVSTYNILSRPDIKAPVMSVFTHTADAAPGYILLTPNSPSPTNITTGPMMYNSAGNLVWFGSLSVTAGFKAYDLQACAYQGTPHLCWTEFRGPIYGGPGGLGSETHILDPSYSVVQNVEPSGKYRNHSLTQDLHEFNMKGTKGDTALIVSYVTVPHNVTYPACNGANTTFTKTGVFSEVTTDGTNKQLFSWAALDHVDPLDTYICPGQPQAGNGKSNVSGFDYFHMNAVDKDSNGDYVVSGRHTSTIYKVAGLNSAGYTPGEIIWRLGGKNNTFNAMNSAVQGAPNLNFSFQHHVRFRPAINGISLWDNANNGVENASALASSGMSISISNDSLTATLINQFVSPGRQLDASQGSHQFLPNENHFLGLGSEPEVFEYTPSGDVAFYAQFGDFPIASYRAFKNPWTGRPALSEIALFAYAASCNASTMAFYASWNGATEIASWKFYSSNSTDNATFALAATAAKNGTFETVGTGTFGLSAYAEAYDVNGTQLGKTETVGTFVPGADLAASCGELACPQGTNYTTASKATC